jgi:LysR family tcuABC transcriptional regulator
MELRQLRYFVRVVELGSMSRAALDLEHGAVGAEPADQPTGGRAGSTRLLQRTPQAASSLPRPVLAFFREAQLALRHAEQAHSRGPVRRACRGTVSVGLAPTTAAMCWACR